MYRGYVKLWRKSMDAGMLRNHKLWTFWCWCLMKATYKRQTVRIGFQEVELFPGQFIFGRHIAMSELHLSEREVRTAVDSLKTGGNLTVKTTNKYSIVTICNWDTYQDSTDGNDRQDDQQTTSKGPTKVHIQEEKERKEDKKEEEIPLIPPATQPEKTEGGVVIQKPISRPIIDAHLPGYQEKLSEAREVIAFLNEKCNKNFSPEYGGIRVIMDRLQEGRTKEECLRIIFNKSHDPLFQRKRNNYCPEVLFRATNFERYLAENPDEYEKKPDVKDVRNGEKRSHFGDGTPYRVDLE